MGRGKVAAEEAAVSGVGMVVCGAAGPRWLFGVGRAGSGGCRGMREGVGLGAEAPATCDGRAGPRGRGCGAAQRCV